MYCYVCRKAGKTEFATGKKFKRESCLSYKTKSLKQIQVQISLFPIKEPLRAEQLTKN